MSANLRHAPQEFPAHGKFFPLGEKRLPVRKTQRPTDKIQPLARHLLFRQNNYIILFQKPRPPRGNVSSGVRVGKVEFVFWLWVLNNKQSRILKCVHMKCHVKEQQHLWFRKQRLSHIRCRDVMIISNRFGTLIISIRKNSSDESCFS